MIINLNKLKYAGSLDLLRWLKYHEECFIKEVTYNSLLVHRLFLKHDSRDVTKLVVVVHYLPYGPYLRLDLIESL